MTPNKEINVLSLSWGVQSFMLACMMVQKEIPMVDVAITADPGYERGRTYILQHEYIKRFREKGLRVEVVSDPKAKSRFEKTNQLFIPAYTKDGHSGKGHMMRSCTHRWKIVPIMRKYRELFGNKQGNMLLGITTDEVLRVKPSRIKYITNKYPLIDLGFSRNQCKAWLKVNEYPIPVKSSCVFCPYHSRSHWEDIRKDGDDWDKAVEIDKHIRNKIDDVECYVHKDRVPLDKVPVQYDLFGDYMDECDGYCFI